MAKKSDQDEIDRRVHAAVKLLSLAKIASCVCRPSSEQWGVSRPNTKRRMKVAREIIRSDYSIDRHDFIGSRLFT